MHDFNLHKNMPLSGREGVLGSDLGHLEINFMDVLLYNGVAKELVVLSEVDIVPRLKVNLSHFIPCRKSNQAPTGSQ